jgi:CobQ-like glutamine amidotransferase family enzyme
MTKEKERVLKIVMLYPHEMNIYGDHGNLESLTHRAGLYGFTVEQILYEPGEEFPSDADIILGGGGQDSGQGKIVDDLTKIAPKLRHLADDGVPMLMICGLYQLFGHYFLTNTGEKIPGIGVFDAITEAGPTRLIGNIVTEWDGYQLVGYENHSGLTRLNAGQKPFATVVKGAGNNGEDGTEGARTGNVFGSYLHGPILPKNTKFADELLRLAVARKYGDEELTPRDQTAADKLAAIDELATQARAIAMTRPR